MDKESEISEQPRIVKSHDIRIDGDYTEWIAELKPLHVQRMSEHVGREFSHVGLTESEWLRLQVDR